jgi:hypothetical protein
MSFQWIIDRAESISINRKRVVASTTARDGTTRSVSRGGQVWQFDVTVPDGIPWSELRANITAAERLDRVSTATIALSNANINWMFGYLGTPVTVPTDIRFRTVTGQSSQIELFDRYFPPFVTISAGQKILGQGDIIQLGTNGYVYTVVEDVLYNTSTFPIVTLHRPLVTTTFSGNVMRIGRNCAWSVICTNFPDWTIIGRDQVGWSGSFTFVENIQ